MPDSLTPEEFALLDGYFQQAIELPAPQRSELIGRVARESPKLGQALKALLEEDRDDGGTFHEAVAEATLLAEDGDFLLGERFGPYLLEQVIGRGGMGAVYLATRVDDEFQQQVAVKTIRFGLESPQILERFRHEREILARLDHPGIARLLDGGTGPRGVPWVAMEYVKGVPLTDHVARERCSLRRRLELFLELCDAIAFVHRSLVVHRDIKPGNVLVTDAGKVKLLDFGIAKLVDEFEGGMPATATQHRAMTPEYASPEQLTGQPVTTSTDIYALGVLLYELLTGARPIRFDSRTPYAVARAVVESTPPAPSTMLAQQGAPARRRRELRGDLDRIVMTAIRKEPERRYASVADLAADVRNYLAGRPVSAQVDSWHYRARKFVTRNPVVTAVATLFVMVVLGFTFVTVRQSHSIAGQRDRAIEAEAVASSTSDFLVRLFQTADPRQEGNRDATAIDLLRAGVAELEDEQIELDPAVRARLHYVLAHALRNLGYIEEGVQSMERAVELNERLYGPESLETAEARHRLGDLLRDADRLDEAYEELTAALEIRRRLIHEDSYEIADSFNNLAILAVTQGKYRESEDLQQASIEMHTRVSGPGSSETGTPLCNMALLKRRQGRLHEAMELLDRAEAAMAQGTDPGSVQWIRWTRARTLLAMGRYGEAQRQLERTRDDYLPLLGPEHGRIVSIERDIATALRMQGDYAAAGRLLDDLEPRVRDGFGEESTQWVRILVERARLERVTGDPQSAASRLHQAIEIHDRLLGPRHFRIARIRISYADALLDLGQASEAERELRHTLTLLPEPDDYPTVVRAAALVRLARILRSDGRHEEAALALAEARRIVDAVADSECIEAGELLLEEALFAAARGEREAARSKLEQASRALEERLPPGHPTLARLRLPTDD